MNKTIILFIICLLLITTVTCTFFDPFSAAGMPSLFWIDMNKQIFRMPAYNPDELRDFPLDPQPGGFWNVTSMAMDPVTGTMYLGIWGGDEPGIYRANYNGKGGQRIIPTSMEVWGIAIDFYTREMFWSEGSWIKKTSLNEVDKVIDVFDTQVNITDLEVDMMGHQLYYVGISNIVYTVSTTGEFPGNVILSYPDAFAKKIELSLFDNKIFWFNDFNQGVYYSDANTGDGGVLLSPPNLPDFKDFSLDRETGHMYWADNMGVHRIRTDGFAAEEMVFGRIDITLFAGDFMNARQY